jgi:hypothetical protein
LARFACREGGEHPAGEQILALENVIDGEWLDSQAAPMAYLETCAVAPLRCFRMFWAIRKNAAPRYY